MDVLVERCAGLDVHRDDVVATRAGRRARRDGLPGSGAGERRRQSTPDKAFSWSSHRTFQHEWTLDIAKLRKCCVAEIVPDGRIIPFCAYNAAGYRAQVRADLAATAAT